MKWAWRIARIGGVDIFIHFTFLFLLAWIGIAHYSERQEFTDVVEGIGFILVIFFIVVLHEFGHSLAARRFGIKTKDITLLPIGGLARLERMPEKPSQELVVAIAGPAVNVVLAVVFGIILTLTGGWSPVEEISVTGGSFMERLFAVNLMLIIFNLLPAFPMDGGRVLRALLAMRKPYPEATRLAATIGQAMALLLGLAGMFFNPMLVFIALFVWVGAAQEAQGVETKSALAGVPIDDLMIRRFQALRRTDSLESVVGYVLEGFQVDFPVIDDHGQVVGILTRNGLLNGLARRQPDLRVIDVMDTNFCVVDRSETVETAVQRLQTGDCTTLPVVDQGRLVGLLTIENVGEFLLIKQARTQTRV
jgi:Zn-dependent protease/predicted transcriptional regulator